MEMLISRLNKRITVCSVTDLPIDDESERIVFGIKIVSDEAKVAEDIYRLVRSDAEIVTHAGARIMVVDTASDDDAAIGDIEFDDEFGDDPLAEAEPEEEEDELKPAKPLFEKRIFVVRNGYLLIGNNLEQMKEVVDEMPSASGNELTEAEDYVRVNQALTRLAGDQAPSFRQFGRMDKTVRTNYEMLRTNRMAQSKTLLAQLLNRAYTTDDTPEDFERKQQVDGSKMPEDFDGQVAKYFGPTGLVIHSMDDGWLVTGVILEKSEDEVSTNVKTGGTDDEEVLVSDDK